MNYQKYLWGFHVIEAMRTPPMWLGGKEDLGRRLQSDKSKGSYVAREVHQNVVEKNHFAPLLIIV